MAIDGSLLPYVGPAVVCVRGPSRSGKTALCERLVAAIEARGKRVAYLKRTHHALDLPDKASGRIWQRGPSAMVLRATDRLQLTLPPGARTVDSLLACFPPGIDLVLLETHTAEPFPTILSDRLLPAAGEEVIGRWALETVEAGVPGLVEAALARLPSDRNLDLALRAALRMHGSHVCAGLVLGTRLALHGAALLGVEVPDGKKRLVVTVETDRCAVDAIQAVTGCRPGKRTMRLLDYGKLAATFIDQWEGRAIRVAARGELRELATARGLAEDRHEAQRLAYLAMRPEELFDCGPADSAIAQFDLPGPPRRRVLCATCGEEVSDGREIPTESGSCCRPCALAVQVSRETEAV
jgi:formylmethanofuran dehydrogenase subunit E